MSESIRSNVITAEKAKWYKNRQIWRGYWIRNAITSFLGISFNNSELCDGKLSVSGFMDDSWYIFGSSDGNGSKIYELTGPPTGGALLEMV